MHETGLREEAGEWLYRHETPSGNPAARFFMAALLTMDRYLAEPFISFPFRRFDYCVETDSERNNHRSGNAPEIANPNLSTSQE